MKFSIIKKPEELDKWVESFQVKLNFFDMLIPTLNITQANIVEDGVVLGNRFFIANGRYVKDSNEMIMEIQFRKKYKIVASVLIIFGMFFLYGFLFSENASLNGVNNPEISERLIFTMGFIIAYGLPFAIFQGFKHEFKTNLIKSANS